MQPPTWPTWPRGSSGSRSSMSPPPASRWPSVAQPPHSMASRVAVSGSLAVVGSASLGMTVVDVSVPAAPKAVGFMSGTINGVARAGQYAYVLISVPGNPPHTDLAVVSLSHAGHPDDRRSRHPRRRHGDQGRRRTGVRHDRRRRPADRRRQHARRANDHQHSGHAGLGKRGGGRQWVCVRRGQQLGAGHRRPCAPAPRSSSAPCPCPAPRRWRWRARACPCSTAHSSRLSVSACPSIRRW